MDSWTIAFSKANQIADEHKDDPFFTKKRIMVDDDHEATGFKQPRKLAQFMKEATSSVPQEPVLDQPSQPCSAIGEERTVEKDYRPSLEERCAKQICRLWLKYEYLNIGEKCNGNCGRLHVVIGNPERLYKDFAFKGLNPHQRKLIITKLKNGDTSMKKEVESLISKMKSDG